MDSARLQPALFGGLFIGVLSALPLVQAGNCCCCLWVIAGGVLAVYLRQQNTPYAIASAEGALMGLLAGAIGGVVTSLLSIPMQAISGPMQERMMDWVVSMNPDFPADLRGMIERGPGSGLFLIASMVFNVVVYSVFGLLGGLLGTAVFKKNAPPPPPGTVEVLPPE